MIALVLTSEVVLVTFAEHLCRGPYRWYACACGWRGEQQACTEHRCPDCGQDVKEARGAKAT